MGVFLGFDTSNYTTSVSAVSENGDVTVNVKIPLPVKEGERGLRQSDAVFHHTNAMPSALERAFDVLQGEKIIAVGASERPRDAEGSYMPCFLVGRAAATSAAKATNVPYFGFSHQCGHIAAAIYSAKKEELFAREFASFHLSGGTTDILIAKPEKETVFSVTRVGGTLDINAGQLIDRTGVLMGLRFPCGAEMEKLALSCTENTSPAVSVSGLDCNLSGLENKASELFRKTEDKALVSRFTVECIVKTVKKLTENLRREYPGIPIVYAGGVSSSTFLKNALSEYGSFAEPSFSSDNAAGVALMTRRKYIEQYGY